MIQKTFYKLVKLDFLGEDQKDSYIKFKRVSYKDSKPLRDLKDISQDNSDEIMSSLFNYLKEIFVEGKMTDDSGQIVEMSSEDIENVLPIDSLKTIIEDLNGVNAF